MDGWITIGTNIDTQDFEKEIKELQKKSTKFAKEIEKLMTKKAKLEVDYKKYLSDLDTIKKEYDEAVAHCSDKIEIRTEKAIADKRVEEANTKYSNSINELNIVNSKIKQNTIEQETCNQKIQEMKNKLFGANINYDNIGKSISNTIKKVGKWALAVFSVRSAYNAIRTAMSILSQYNEDLANKLNSIKLVFASALEPIVTRIVDLIYRLMVYMNYISKAWFGVDLFAKASAASMSKASKSAKEIRKDMFGFDEANIQNDDGSIGSSGAVGNEFTMPDNVEIPSWIDWIAKNKDIVLGFFIQLGVIWGTLKVANFVLKLKNLKDGLFSVSNTAGKTNTTLQSFGKAVSTGLIITGLAILCTSLYKLIASWNDLTPAERNAEIALVLLGTAFTILGITMRAAIDTGTFGLAKIVGLVAGLGLAIASLITYLDREKNVVHSLKDAENNLKNAQEELRQAAEDYTNTLDAYDNALIKATEALKKLEDAERKNKMSGEELFNQVSDGKLKYEDMNKAQQEVYKAYWNNIAAQDNLKKSTEELTNKENELIDKKKNGTIASFENEHALLLEGKRYDEYKQKVIDAYTNGSLKADEARTLIEKSMSDMSDDARKTFTQDLPNAIKEGLEPKKYESFGSKLKNWFSGLWKSIWGTAPSTNGTVKLSYSGGGGGGFAKGGIISGSKVYGFAKGGIAYPRLKYCASGAIINQPGRGVPITQAIGGERGQEGILPLTDNQQMDYLGSSIAKHTVINATIPVYVGNKMVAREFRKIEAQRDFATNGG